MVERSAIRGSDGGSSDLRMSSLRCALAMLSSYASEASVGSTVLNVQVRHSDHNRSSRFRCPEDDNPRKYNNQNRVALRKACQPSRPSEISLRVSVLVSALT